MLVPPPMLLMFLMMLLMIQASYAAPSVWDSAYEAVLVHEASQKASHMDSHDDFMLLVIMMHLMIHGLQAVHTVHAVY